MIWILGGKKMDNSGKNNNVRPVALIHTWKPTKEQDLIERDGKLFIFHFEKVFGHDKKSSVYNKFMIGKDSYCNILDDIIKYVNFFINVYDKENELPSAYFECKFVVDKLKMFDESNMDAYIDFLYEILFTDEMIAKIKKMVEENYLDDIETDSNHKYKNSEKKHLESLEFTNEHIKILLEISFAMKMMSPCMLHFFKINNIKLTKYDGRIFRFYTKLFEIFGFPGTWEIDNSIGDTIEEGIPEEDALARIKEGNLVESRDEKEPNVPRYICGVDEETGEVMYLTKTYINMHNKLYVYCKTKVQDSNSTNGVIFGQREVMGVDVMTVVRDFTRRVLISENVVKYKFNEIWDNKLHKYKENIIGFNKTILKFQLNYFLKEQYDKNMREVSNIKDEEGVSGVDKMLMNKNKLNEGDVTMSEINIEMTIDRIKKKIDVPIDDAEIDYYMKNHTPSPLQIFLINSYYAKYFGNYRDLNLITRRQYITILIILKKKLLIDLGFDSSTSEIHYAALPYILTGNISEKASPRMMRATSTTSDLEDSADYQELVNVKYAMVELLKPGYIKNLFNNIVKTKFTYVTYENQELTGTEILYDEGKIKVELMSFLNYM